MLIKCKKCPTKYESKIFKVCPSCKKIKFDFSHKTSIKLYKNSMDYYFIDFEPR